jgi:hypothetical protein
MVGVFSLRMLTVMPSNPTVSTGGKIVEPDPQLPSPPHVPKTPTEKLAEPEDRTAQPDGHTINTALGWISGIGLVGLLIGAMLIVTGALLKSKATQAISAVSLAWAAFSHSSFIGSIKVGDVLKIEKASVGIKDPKLDLSLKNNDDPNRALAGFEPLWTLTEFPLGESKLTANMQQAVDEHVCSELISRKTRGQTAAVIIVGGTDRVRVNEPTQHRFESNFGLAEARSRAAMEAVGRCKIKPAAVMTLTSGPHAFPDRPLPLRPPGEGNDRRAEFWVHWQAGEVAQAQPAAEPPTRWFAQNGLTLFGIVASALMVAFYYLEPRSLWFALGLACACGLAAIYAFFQRAWPFVGLEAVWLIVALNKWNKLRDPRAGIGQRAKGATVP